MSSNGMLVPVRTGVDLRRRNESNNELYQLKVDTIHEKVLDAVCMVAVIQWNLLQ